MTVYILSPFESKMAQRGTRHPSLAEFLVNKGYPVEYVSTNFSHARKEYFSRDEIRCWEEILPYKLTVLKIFGYYNNLSIRRVLAHCFLSMRMFSYLVHRLHPDDTVVIPSRPPELIFSLLLLKLIYKMHVVVDIRDIWPDMLPSKSKIQQGIFSVYCHMFLYLSLPRMDRFVHIAPVFTKWLKRYAPQKSSVFIPLGYDEQRWKSSKNLDKEGLNGKIDLVYVGAVTRQIDLSGVIQAIANDHRYRLTIIGDGENLDQLKQDASRAGIENIHFTGFVAYDEVVERLRRMHIGIIPMTGHAMPNKLFDYIAARRPILVLGENDAATLVTENHSGWQQPFHGPKLSEFFERLTMHDISRMAMGVEQIRKRFSKENLYRDYINIIENRN